MKTVLTVVGFFAEIEEGTERAIHDFENLLTDSCLEHRVVLIVLDGVIVRFVAQVSSFGKEILPDRIQCHVIQVFGVPTHFTQGFVFGFR